MEIKDFVGQYRNHPVLFIGTGISLRYLKESYTWDGLLQKISNDLSDNNEAYLDIKYQCVFPDGTYNFAKIATILEHNFNKALETDRDGKFKFVNDEFYENMSNGICLSRFKIYVSNLLKNLAVKEEMQTEVSTLKKVRKNIGSIITTNYDRLIEDIFEFQPLVGNDILLSNPYGSVYKIHGCVSDPSKIIVTEDDYSHFSEKYELIRAQLLSIFIHNPIIFMGYGIGDDNIKSLLKTIFTYVESNSDDAERIRANFLLVEYERDSQSLDICEHDIDMEGFSTIRINKIKTDDFSSIYESLSGLKLPVSAMDIRKVQSIVKTIYAGGDIKVNITEDLDSLKNSDKIIAIGSDKTIRYQYQTQAEMMMNYFNILDEHNSQVLSLINKYKIQKTQFFPIFGFCGISNDIDANIVEALKKQQQERIEDTLESLSRKNLICECKLISEILEDEKITISNKSNAIFLCVNSDLISLNELEYYLRSKLSEINSSVQNIDLEKPKLELTTSLRKLLCIYDYKRYSSD